MNYILIHIYSTFYAFGHPEDILRRHETDSYRNYIVYSANIRLFLNENWVLVLVFILGMIGGYYLMGKYNSRH